MMNPRVIKVIEYEEQGGNGKDMPYYILIKYCDLEGNYLGERDGFAVSLEHIKRYFKLTEKEVKEFIAKG